MASRRLLRTTKKGFTVAKLTSLYYERTKNPETETLIKIADYLGVTIDELLTPEE